MMNLDLDKIIRVATATSGSFHFAQIFGIALFGAASSPLALAAGAYLQTTATQVIAGNANVELVFSKPYGSLVNLLDKNTGHDMITQKTAGYNGFILSYTNPGSTTLRSASGFMARSVSLSPTTTGKGVQVAMQFDQLLSDNLTRLDVSARMVVTVDDSSPLTAWQLSVDNREQITIESVMLPFLQGIGQISNDPAADYLAYPSLSGILFQDPVHNLLLNKNIGFQQYYPGESANMQFIAYYSRESGAGLYLANQDSSGYAKYLSVGRQNSNWMNVQSTYVPAFQAGAGVTVPYTVILGVFHGDWFDAANVYRDWALHQPWTQNGPLVTRSDTPDWYKQTGILAWALTLLNGSPFSNVPKIASAWQKEIHGQSILTWYGWERNGQWIDGPDFFPPSEGWDSFDSAVAGTHTAGSRLQVLPTTNAATVGAPSWANLQAAAARKRDGSLYTQDQMLLGSSGTLVPQTIARMDPTQLWHDAILNFTSQLAQHGIDLVHMDGNPSRGGLCFATDHEHPPGGGNWWFQSLAGIYADMRKTGRGFNPDFAMGGEYFAEPFLALTDSGGDATNSGLDPTAIAAGSVIDGSKVSYIPLWQAVYHDYTLTYSMKSFLDGHDAAFYRRGLGLALVTGEIPAVWGNSEGNYPAWELDKRNQDLLGYAQGIAAFRTTYGYRFAVLGRMLRPPRPAVPTYRVPGATRIPYTLANVRAFDAPSVLSGAWQSPDGDAALVFTNISDSPVSFSWTVTSADVLLSPENTYDAYVLKNGACIAGQPGATLPYELQVDSNPSEIITVIFSQSAGNPPRFQGCSPAVPVRTAVINAAGGQSDVSASYFASIHGSNFTPLASGRLEQVESSAIRPWPAQ